MEIVPLQTQKRPVSGLRPVRPALAHAFYCRNKGPDKDTRGASSAQRHTEYIGIKTKELSRVSGEAPSTRVAEPKQEG